MKSSVLFRFSSPISKDPNEKKVISNEKPSTNKHRGRLFMLVTIRYLSVAIRSHLPGSLALLQ